MKSILFFLLAVPAFAVFSAENLKSIQEFKVLSTKCPHFVKGDRKPTQKDLANPELLNLAYAVCMVEVGKAERQKEIWK